MSNQTNKSKLDYIQELEKALKDKYGKDTITNPKSLWDTEKEEDYLKQVKEYYQNSSPVAELEDIAGVLIPSKLLIKEENNRICVSCKIYSFNRRDDLYMNKFRCCFKCYIQFVEGREEKWQQRLK